MAQIARLMPDLVAHAGGMVGSTQIARWRDFEQLTAPLTDFCPFYGCRGRGENRAYIVARDGSPEPRLLGDNHFSFDFRGAHFVFLDTEERVDRDDPQTRWLSADLASAAGKPIFVFTHRAVFGAAERFILVGGEQWWHPLFVRHRVRIVFSGARHLYHRVNEGGVAYVITGGGGGPLDPVMARRQLAPGDVAASFNHCLEVTLAHDEIRCRAVDPEGRTRDEFAVRASGALGEVEY
ncbi:MAG TPA: hypothetical protein PLE19_09495 [Planctomycetota bacterium]|nr:hypothetical protein [Planctomycetota bacterium]HRR79509.1 hypothetical protein [Planctomycetota bacterium]